MMRNLPARRRLRPGKGREVVIGPGEVPRRQPGAHRPGRAEQEAEAPRAEAPAKQLDQPPEKTEPRVFTGLVDEEQLAAARRERRKAAEAMLGAAQQDRGTKRTKRRKSKRRLGPVTIVGIPLLAGSIALVTWGLMALNRGPEEVLADREAPPQAQGENSGTFQGAASSPRGIPPGETLLLEFLQTGLSQRDQIESLLLEGELAFDSQLLEFTILKKRPRLLRLEFEVDSNTSIAIGNTRTGELWHAVLLEGEVMNVEEPPEELAQKVTLLTHFDILRTDRLAGEWRRNPANVTATDEGTDDIDGVEVQLLRLTNREGEFVVAAYDTETDRILEERFDLDGKSIRVRYADWQQIDNFRFPTEITHFRNGERLDHMSLQRIAPNRGVLSDLFERPSLERQAGQP